MGIRITPDVTTLVADANTPIAGNVQLVSGTNVTLSQSAQAITVNSTPSSGPPITVNDEGTFTVATTGRLLQPNRLTLSGTERSTLAGTGRTVIADVLNYEPSKGVTPAGSFNIMDSEYALQFKRLSLFGNSRLTETGTGREDLVDILGVPSGPGITSDGISKITLTGNPSSNSVMDGLVVSNNNIASSGNQQYSPAITFQGSGWATGNSSSRTSAARISFRPRVNSINTNLIGGDYVFSSNENGGGYNDQLIISPSFGSEPTIIQDGAPGGSPNFRIDNAFPGGISFNTTRGVYWTAGNASQAKDTGLARNAANVVEVNNGTSGSFADLICRNLSARGNVPPPITQNDEGTFQVPNTGYLTLPDILTLSGSERATIVGTGRTIITDFTVTNTPLSKVTLSPASFILRAGEYVMQYLRLALAGNTRATLTENARIVNFEFRPPSHLVLAGAGL